MEILILGTVLLVFTAGPIVLLVLHLIARDRLNKLERSSRAAQESLAARVELLEARLRALGGVDEGDPAISTGAAPASPVAPVDVPAPRLDPVSVSSEAAPASPAAPVDVPAPRLDPATVSSEAASDSGPRSGADWEEIIGGSWLSKIGSVVLVVGIALTLGYSMRWLGPLGRVALGFAMSAAMLAGGVLLEGRERYRIAARGLVGGGWAGLYFTTFAMHGLEAARVVDDPVVATGLLIGVAVAMLIHAVSYRSETVTALAYFVTFGTLSVVPASRFALAASVPAAASLLYIGRRFRWSHMMVAGVVFTYGAYLIRGGSVEVRPQDWAFGQALLFFYWVVFEAFDLLSTRATSFGLTSGGSRRSAAIDQTLMPINAVGFLGVSLLGWSEMRPESLWTFFLLASTCFAASAAVRAGLIGGTAALGGDDEAGKAGRPAGRPAATYGGYAASLSISAFLMVFAIERGFEGWRETVTWLLLAELLVVSGVVLRNGFLRHLGSAVLAVPVLAVLFDDLSSSRTFLALGRSWSQATPLALLTSLVLYGNRALLRRAVGVRVAGLEHVYNWFATLFLVAVVAIELPDVWIAPAWFGLGLVLIGLGNLRGAGELYVQGSGVLAAAWVLAMLGNVPADDLVAGWPARWLTALPLAPALYALAYRARGAATAAAASVFGSVADASSGSPDRIEAAARPRRIDAIAGWLDGVSSLTMSTAATVLITWFLLYEVSGRWLTVAWGVQGVVLLAAGLLLQARGLRLGGLALLGLCIAKLFAYDLSELDTLFQIFSFIILGTLLIAVSFAYGRYREQIRRLL